MPRKIGSEQSKKIDVLKIHPLLTLKNIIIVGILLLALLIWRYKNYFIVATINGQPISRWELNDNLMARYGTQALDNIINERLILAGARQKGIFITANEIIDRTNLLQNRLPPNTTLKDALSQQGLNEDMFRRQVEIQLSIEKIFSVESTVSAKEVDDFILKNQSFYKNATNPATLKEEVNETLRQQKISDNFEKWFSEVRKNANIKKSI